MILADIPGVDPNAIEIQMDKSILSIKGERTVEEIKENEKVTRSERTYGQFIAVSRCRRRWTPKASPPRARMASSDPDPEETRDRAAPHRCRTVNFRAKRPAVDSFDRGLCFFAASGHIIRETDQPCNSRITTKSRREAEASDGGNQIRVSQARAQIPSRRQQGIRRRGKIQVGQRSVRSAERSRANAARTISSRRAATPGDEFHPPPHFGDGARIRFTPICTVKAASAISSSRCSAACSRRRRRKTRRTAPRTRCAGANRNPAGRRLQRRQGTHQPARRFRRSHARSEDPGRSSARPANPVWRDKVRPAQAADLAATCCSKSASRTTRASSWKDATSSHAAHRAMGSRTRRHR